LIGPVKGWWGGGPSSKKKKGKHMIGRGGDSPNFAGKEQGLAQKKIREPSRTGGGTIESWVWRREKQAVRKHRGKSPCAGETGRTGNS